jgi:predicted acetyltransferase
MINIEKVKIEDKNKLAEMLQLYLHEFSLFDQRQQDENGIYPYKYFDLYWQESDRLPLFIIDDKEIVGFALLILDDPESEQKDIKTISEFFVLEKFRKKGIGKNAAFKIFDMFHGKWAIRQLEGNTNAKSFWKRVVDEYTEGNFREGIWKKGQVITFSNQQR